MTSQKRWPGVEQELKEILGKFDAKKTVTFFEIRELSVYNNEESRRKWAIYRINELIKIGQIRKIKRGFYERT